MLFSAIVLPFTLLIFGSPCSAQNFFTNLVNNIQNPDPDSIFSLIDLPPISVKFLLYTPANEVIHLSSWRSSKYLDPSIPTKVVLHGWRNRADAAWIHQLATLYHSNDAVNFIAVDWSTYAQQNYLLAVNSVQLVGNMAGDFLSKLANKELVSLNTTHVIGHSLGAHVAGVMGTRVFLKQREKVDRITGLDAAGLFYSFPFARGEELRLNKGDAGFVDTVHTNGGIHGILGSYGDVDFYVNDGGPFQPGCSLTKGGFVNATFCSHQSAHVFFAKSMLMDFVGVKCANRLAHDFRQCTFNDTALMGEYVPRNISGNYYVNTNSSGASFDFSEINQDVQVDNNNNNNHYYSNNNQNSQIDNNNNNYYSSNDQNSQMENNKNNYYLNKIQNNQMDNNDDVNNNQNTPLGNHRFLNNYF